MRALTGSRAGLACLALVATLAARAASADDRLSVVVSLPDIVPIVTAVGGPYVDPYVVMPAGGDPHSYTVSAELVRRASGADLLVFAHSRFFTFEEHLAENLPGVPVTDWPDYVRHGARLLDFPGLPQNSHGFYLDHANGWAIANAVAEALIARGVPEAVIRSNMAVFRAELAAATATGRDLAARAGLAGDTVIIAVPPVAYVASNLGIAVAGYLIAEGSASASGARLAEFAGQLRSGRAKGILCPISMRESKPGEISEQIARENGGFVRYVRFQSAGPGQESYLSQAYYNAAAATAGGIPEFRARDGDASADANGALLYLVAAITLGIVVAVQAYALVRLRRRGSEPIAGHGIFARTPGGTEAKSP